MTPTAKLPRAVGIGALVLQLFFAGSYASTVARAPVLSNPPTAYRMPLTTPAACPCRGVGMGAFGVQVPAWAKASPAVRTNANNTKRVEKMRSRKRRGLMAGSPLVLPFGRFLKAYQLTCDIGH